MKMPPRNLRLTLALLLACGSNAHAAAAQTGTASKAGGSGAAARDPKRAREKKAAASARAERSRRKAVAVLLEVAAGAGDIEDLYQRATVLTLSAGALWGADEPAARAAFARAWEAAAAADEAESEDERESGRRDDPPERFTRARSLVLAAAAQRDTRISEPWLAALADWLTRQEGDARGEAAGASPDIGPPNEFTRDGQRLALAHSLLDEEAPEAAARVAALALQGGASGALVEFLLRLREDAPEEADRLYL